MLLIVFILMFNYSTLQLFSILIKFPSIVKPAAFWCPPPPKILARRETSISLVVVRKLPFIFPGSRAFKTKTTFAPFRLFKKLVTPSRASSSRLVERKSSAVIIVVTIFNFLFSVSLDNTSPQNLRVGNDLFFKTFTDISFIFAPRFKRWLAISSEEKVVAGLEKLEVSVTRPVKRKVAVFLLIAKLNILKRLKIISDVEEDSGKTKFKVPKFSFV